MNARKDLVGMRFGRLVVLRSTTRNRHGDYRWECVCDCGGVKEVLSTNLRGGSTKSCGCIAATKGPDKDLTGAKFGRLTVLRRGVRDALGAHQWECICDCGGVATVRGSNLRCGQTQSCGCLSREMSAERGRKSRVHGFAGTPEYRTWHAMMHRCLDEKNQKFRSYGGRGITVCKEWFDFDRFIADMGKKPSKDYQLDRIDNNKGYSKENCRWATRSENQRNRRCTVYVILNGKRVSLSEAAEITGIKPKTLYARVMQYGLTPETGLFRPVTQPHQ